MKVAVVGSRSYRDLPLVKAYVESLPLDTVIISGGADGVDTQAIRTAVSRKMITNVYPANWKKYGKSAGMIRNKTIVDSADLVVAFWDGESRGTKSSIELARKAGKLLCVVYEIGEER